MGNAGAALLASLPAGARGLVEPYLPAIVDAVHPAFSIATASTFVVEIGTTLVASGLVLVFREVPAQASESARGDEPASDDDLEVVAA